MLLKCGTERSWNVDKGRSMWGERTEFHGMLYLLFVVVLDNFERFDITGKYCMLWKIRNTVMATKQIVLV